MHGAQRIHPSQMSIKLTLLGQLQTMIKCQKRLVRRAICHIAQKNWVVSGKRDSQGLISLVVMKGKVRVTGKCCSLAFIWMAILKDFIRRLESWNHLVQGNKQLHRNVHLSSFHLNGHTYEFHQDSKVRISLPFTLAAHHWSNPCLYQL